MYLRDKIVWLTGAGSGIGEGLALELARRGAQVALTGRTRETLETVARDIAHGGGKAVVIPADVTKADEIQNGYRTLVTSLGTPHIVIANAGTHIETWPEQFKGSEYLSIMDINFGGMIRLFDAVLPEMIARKEGTIVGVASLAGFRGLPRAAAYGASKSAIIHFLESIRFHLRHCGVRVVTINPGFVKTPLTDKNDFHMPFLLTIEESARAICDGLEAEKTTISYPPLFALLFRVMRILPEWLYNFLVEKQWQRMEARKR